MLALLGADLSEEEEYSAAREVHEYTTISKTPGGSRRPTVNKHRLIARFSLAATAVAT